MSLHVSVHEDGKSRELFIYNYRVFTTVHAKRIFTKESGVKYDESTGEWDDYQHIEFFHKGDYVGAIWEE